MFDLLRPAFQIHACENHLDDTHDLCRNWAPGSDEGWDVLLGDPPQEAGERRHWEAVWRSLKAFENSTFNRGRESPVQEEHQRRRARMQARVASCHVPIATSKDGYELIALLPAPASLHWIAVYLHRNFFFPRDTLEPDRFPRFYELGSSVTHIEIFDRNALPSARPVLWNLGFGRIEVQLRSFLNIHPHFFFAGAYEDSDGEMHEWHTFPGFERLPTTSEGWRLRTAFSYSSRIGGFCGDHTWDGYEPMRAPDDGRPLEYAFQLASDFFDCTFGDKGSLHVYVCPERKRGYAQTESG